MKQEWLKKNVVKLAALGLALSIALGSMGLSYGYYTLRGGSWDSLLHDVTTTSTTECSVIFTCANGSDNEYTFTEPKDVGVTTGTITDSGKRVIVLVDNAYPGYEGYVALCLLNNGLFAATITGITINNPNPDFITVGLNANCFVGAVLQPGQVRNCTLTVGGVPQLEEAQDQTFTFDITIDFGCVPTNCNTAYAYRAGNGSGGCSPYAATCFTAFGFRNWGWSNGKLGPGTYTFDIYAGAAGCVLSRGKKVGTLTLVYSGGTATVTYNMSAGNFITSTHLYIGSEPMPRVNGTGPYTASPGQFPYKHENLEYVSSDSFTVTGLSGCIYIVAHAGVCY